MDGWEIARKDQVSLKNKIRQLQQPRTSRVRSLRSPAEPALDLRARCSSVAIMASGEPLAGVKQTLKEKRTSETTALDFVPSWAGQLQGCLRQGSHTPINMIERILPGRKEMRVRTREHVRNEGSR